LTAQGGHHPKGAEVPADENYELQGNNDDYDVEGHSASEDFEKKGNNDDYDVEGHKMDDDFARGAQNDDYQQL